ncbi:hypothetical protein HK102_012852, partial [Quaeritorhiza haematococci]
MYKSTNSIKALKGIATIGSQSIINLFLTASAFTSVAIPSSVLSDVVIESGLADSLIIGQASPASGRFTTLISGSDGRGYNVLFYSSVAGKSLQWDPTVAQLRIGGSLSVTETADLGNLKIRGNTIAATNGIHLEPGHSHHVTVSGGLVQRTLGPVHFEHATGFKIKSETLARVHARTDLDLVSNSGIRVSNVLAITALTNGPHGILVSTEHDHNVAVGDTVDLIGTNSVPGVDGLKPVIQVIDSQTFVVPGFVAASGTTGQVRGSGTIRFESANGVEIPHIKMRSNDIIGETDRLIIRSKQLRIQDPVVAMDAPPGSH